MSLESLYAKTSEFTCEVLYEGEISLELLEVTHCLFSILRTLSLDSIRLCENLFARPES